MAVSRTLKSGRTVVVKEISALEDIMAYQLISKDIDKDNLVASGVLHRSVLTLLSIVTVNGTPPTIPATIDDVYIALAGYKKREWDEISELYNEANDEGETEEEQVGE